MRMDSTFGLRIFQLRIGLPNSVIKFTFFWKRDQRWQGENFQVSVV
jgi:hypothetical protein